MEEPPPQQQHQLQEQEQDHQQPQTPSSSSPKEKECTHKTKLIQFLGRTTPIILQNENGPCPLLAICNVLLLRNNLNLSADAVEVSQEKLLSLIAERLIDSNSNVDNKDAGYVENQQQNIADAIELLPRLATGIDVNIKFRRIDDFEFTPECAIFDLLDIPLCHGWIVDPQDYDTANAIGSKSYNALMEELVALETQNMHEEPKINTEEDCVDFAAATTATLGVPSPSLSKTLSFDDSPRSTSNSQIMRKGDLEEEAELLRVLKLSEADSVGKSNVDEIDACNMSAGFDESICPEKVTSTVIPNAMLEHSGAQYEIHSLKPSTIENHDILSGTEEASLSTKTDGRSFLDHSENGEATPGSDVTDKVNADSLLQVKDALVVSSGNPPQSVNSSSENCFQEKETVEGQPAFLGNKMESLANQSESCGAELASSPALYVNTESSNGTLEHIDTAEPFSPTANSSEPIYEGEERILDSGQTAFEDREPVYEGEVILAEQADKTSTDAHNVRSKDAITPQQGELIGNFLRSSASQLTFYGLFSLQDDLKERELCVFFRNNHFSTMFKYEGELYLLATDQGYLNQPDLVWEKLNEVNGDTLFMTSNFKEFNMENQSNKAWDEHNAMASTADYIASIDSAAQAGLNMNSDLQLAIALQQQEFEQQNSQRQSQQPPSIGGSRLVTGPTVPRHSGRNYSSNKPDTKSKDRCSIM